MTASVSGVRLFSPEYYQNPFPTFAWLREHSPVHEFRFPMGDVRMWMVTRYDDVRAILADDRFSSDGGTWGSPEFKAAGLVIGAGSLLERSLPFIDPPAHERMRRFAMSAFTRRHVSRWRDASHEVVSSALSRCAELGSFDATKDYASPVSVEVLARVLGFPVEWHADLVRVINEVYPTDPALLQGVPAAFLTMCDHARELVALKRRQPGDDLTSGFVLARDEGGDRLDEGELLTLVATVIMAGVETARALLGGAILALLDRPDQWQLLRSRPDLMATAVEELIRFVGVNSNALFRLAKEDVEFGGTVLPAGAPVLAGLLAANRDPAHYEDPDRLDITRKGMRHLALGHGLHNCLGAALARLETETAVPAFFTRFPDIALAVPREELRYDANWALRRLVSLPVSTSPGG